MGRKVDNHPAPVRAVGRRLVHRDSCPFVVSAVGIVAGLDSRFGLVKRWGVVGMGSVPVVERALRLAGKDGSSLVVLVGSRCRNLVGRAEEGRKVCFGEVVESCFVGVGTDLGRDCRLVMEGAVVGGFGRREVAVDRMMRLGVVGRRVDSVAARMRV